MTDNIVSPLLQWLNAHPQLAGLATFTISAGESVAILGTIVPGSIMMTALGALAGAGVIPLWETIIWAILGAIVGDGISYWIGHYFKDSLRRIWPFRRHPSLLRTGEIFFHKYGSMSVFIGRFVGPVRALVPMVAGMLGMKPLQFTIANVTSAIGWAPAYMLPGILLGAASLELPPDIAIHVILVLFLITLFVMLCLWFLYKSLQLINQQIDQVQDWIWRSMKKSWYFSSLTVLLKHHDRQQTHGQLNLAIYFIITSCLFIALAFYVTYHGPANIMANDVMFHLFRGIRTDTIDNYMIYITLLGQKQVILPVVLIFFAWLIVAKHWRVAFHVLALGILAAGSVFVLKNLLQSPRPWGIFNSPETYSMPSGHATLATTVYMGLAFLIALSFRPHRRWPIYMLGILMTLAVSMSRIYLGAHWFTDVLSSWFLSAAVLIVVIISYQRRAEKPIKPLAIVLVSMTTLMLATVIYHERNVDHLTTNYAQINYPVATVSMEQFWHNEDILPAYRASLFGFPTQHINIQWVGDLDQIKDALNKEGWTKPPARDFVSTLHRIADISSTEYLPLVSPQYLDKKPSLIMTRNLNGEKGLLVIRLWDSNRLMKDTNKTIWVGIVAAVPRSYSWLFQSNHVDIEIDPAYVFPTKTAMGDWQWKIQPATHDLNTHSDIKQQIMFTRQNKSIHKRKQG